MVWHGQTSSFWLFNEQMQDKYINKLMVGNIFPIEIRKIVH